MPARSGPAAALLAGGIAAYRYARPVVTVTEVVRGPVVQAFYATGTLSPVREHPVKAPVEGTLERLDDAPDVAVIDKGSRVRKGQPLIENAHSLSLLGITHRRITFLLPAPPANASAQSLMFASPRSPARSCD